MLLVHSECSVQLVFCCQRTFWSPRGATALRDGEASLGESDSCSITVCEKPGCHLCLGAPAPGHGACCYLQVGGWSRRRPGEATGRTWPRGHCASLSGNCGNKPAWRRVRRRERRPGNRIFEGESYLYQFFFFYRGLKTRRLRHSLNSSVCDAE